MLPRIHLGSLLSATNSELANQSKEHRQAVRDKRVTKDMEGFYVYQTYLRRLRRMHRAYVSKYRKAHPSSSSRSLVPPPGTSQFYIAREKPPYSSDSYFMPRHRLSMSDSTSVHLRGHHPQDTSRVDLAPPPPPSPDVPLGQSEETTPSSSSPASPGSIYIPCGRENSFDGKAGLALRYPNQLDSIKSNPSVLNFPGPQSQLHKAGAMSFRVWRREKGKTGVGTVYSLSTVKEEQATNETKMGNFPKLLHRNVNVVSNYN